MKWFWYEGTFKDLLVPSSLLWAGAPLTRSATLTFLPLFFCLLSCSALALFFSLVFSSCGDHREQSQICSSEEGGNYGFFLFICHALPPVPSCLLHCFICNCRSQPVGLAPSEQYFSESSSNLTDSFGRKEEELSNSKLPEGLLPFFFFQHYSCTIFC